MKTILILLASVLLLSSCVSPSNSSSFRSEAVSLEENQKRLIESAKTPTLSDSLERKNIAKRAELFNKGDKLSYIYLVSYGKIISFHTVRGKISSVSSYLTPQEKLVYGDGSTCKEWSVTSPSCYTVQAPDIDGSYGTNGEWIFFFTTEWAYIEWKGDYLMSDFPLTIVDTPSLIREVK